MFLDWLPVCWVGGEGAECDMLSIITYFLSYNFKYTIVVLFFVQIREHYSDQ